jgi:phage I-like protein
MIEHLTLLANEAALDQDGWALIAPFGEHPKTRFVTKNGTVQREQFIQVLDHQSADQLLSRENSLFRRIRRAVVGIPVYKGHPDLGDFSPEIATTSAKKEIIGTIDKVRKTERGLEAHFVLTPAGADAVEREGCKYPSALWYVQPVGRRGSAVLARPFKLLSAGLTAHPNISGVESLANARPAGPTQEPTPTQEPEMKLIAGWLLANGATLANADSPSESEVLAALQKLHASAAGEAAALGNENFTLTGENADL